VLGLSGWLLAAPAHAAVDQGIGIRLVDAPVNRKGDPRAALFVVDHVRPGTHFARRFEVSNGTPNQVRLQLYPSAAQVTASGWSVLAGRVDNELVSWTKVTPAQVTLEPGQKQIATLDITVPANASTGERYAVVLAELPAVKNSKGLAVASRVGIRVYLDVGPGGEPPSSFTISTLTAERTAQGEPAIAATVKNTGGRALDLSGTATLSNGPGGLRAGPFREGNVTTLAIGGTGDVLIKLDKSLPAGPWLARLDMQSGFIKHSVTGTLTFPDKGSAAPVTAKLVESKSSIPAWLLAVLGIAVLAVIGLLILFLLKRRSRPEDRRDVIRPS
jgi:hypothetical protein